jgi:hypothetical protein
VIEIANGSPAGNISASRAGLATPWSNGSSIW